MNRLTLRIGGHRPSERLGHRPGLDGLRGLAVLLVLAQHLGLPVFRGGGLVGVLLFFVLSGFLITWLLLDEHAATGRIDIRAFYVRRARRLLPAFVAMLAVVVGVAALVGNLGGIAGPAIVAGAYVANWSHLFDIDMGPLNHTWSLSVEEQFYIVWPAVLIGFFAFRRLGWVILAACVAAVLWFMPMTGGAIAFGALLGVVVRRNLVPAMPAAVGWAAIGGPGRPQRARRERAGRRRPGPSWRSSPPRGWARSGRRSRRSSAGSRWPASAASATACTSGTCRSSGRSSQSLPSTCHGRW